MLFGHCDRLSSSRPKPKPSLGPGNPRYKRQWRSRVPNAMSGNRISAGSLASTRPSARLYTSFTHQRRCPYQAFAGQPKHNICGVETMVQGNACSKSYLRREHLQGFTAKLSLRLQGFTTTLAASSAFLGSARVIVRLECCE